MDDDWRGAIQNTVRLRYSYSVMALQEARRRPVVGLSILVVYFDRTYGISGILT